MRSLGRAIGDHPLTGRFVPELTVAVGGGRTRIAELARTGRPLLLDLGAGIAPDARDWCDRLDVVVATHPDTPAPALLIRPDGVVAWAGADDGLLDALRQWFGAARPDPVIGAPAPT